MRKSSKAKLTAVYISHDLAWCLRGAAHAGDVSRDHRGGRTDRARRSAPLPPYNQGAGRRVPIPHVAQNRARCRSRGTSVMRAIRRPVAASMIVVRSRLRAAARNPEFTRIAPGHRAACHCLRRHRYDAAKAREEPPRAAFRTAEHAQLARVNRDFLADARA